jgi:hypothetical protein
MTRVSTALVGMAAVALGAGRGGAQEWRTLESSRQARGPIAPIDVRVQYAAGTIDITPTAEPILYRIALRYDAEQAEPMASFDEDTRILQLGVRALGSMAWRSGNRDGGSLSASLSDQAPMRLSLELGATRARVQLGGLKLRRLELRTGAAETRVDVGAPNSDSLDLVSLDIGAAKVTVARAGNLRARRAEITVGAGALDYDLAGVWTGETTLDATVAVGGLTVRIPADAGVRVTATTFLASFDKAGLVKRGDAWESPGYADAARRVRIDATATLGSFEIVRR